MQTFLERRETHGEVPGDRGPQTGRRARAPSPRCQKRSLSVAPKWDHRKDVFVPEKLLRGTAQEQDETVGKKVQR